MKNPVSSTAAVVLTPRGPVPFNRQACYPDPDPGGRKPVLVLLDPVILDLEEYGPAGVLTQEQEKQVA